MVLYFMTESSKVIRGDQIAHIQIEFFRSFTILSAMIPDGMSEMGKQPGTKIGSFLKHMEFGKCQGQGRLEDIIAIARHGNRPIAECH